MRPHTVEQNRLHEIDYSTFQFFRNVTRIIVIIIIIVITITITTMITINITISITTIIIIINITTAEILPTEKIVSR